MQLLLQDLRGGAAALAPWLEHETGHRTGAGTAAAAAHATVDQEGLLDLGNPGGELGNFSGIAFHIIQRGHRVRTGHREDETFIFHRCRFLWRACVQETATDQHDQAKHGDHGLGIQRAMQAALIGVVQFVEAIIQPQLELALGVVGVMRNQDLRAHHRRQRERNHARQQHRAGQGEREFGEQHAGHPTLETNRQIHRNQGGGHRHHRPRQFTRAANRGVHRLHAFFDMPVDVLQHDDRIVHHDANGQHHRQQGQQIDGEAHQQHQEQPANQR